MKRASYLTEIWAKNPFPQASHHGQSLNNLPPEGNFVTRGRINEIKAGEIHLISDGRQRTFTFNQNLELAKGFKLSDCLTPGDFIEVLGLRKKEKLEIEGVTLLVPSRRACPFPSTSFDHLRARHWQKFVKAIRAYFQDEGFTELRTPTLVPSPGLEPYLEPFETRFDRGRAGIIFYLPTSPEFHLKKSLTMGFEKCFELKECFRNNELSENHQPEFLMLEWYRAFEDNHALIRDLRDLLKMLQKAFPETNKTVQDVKVVLQEQLWKECLDFELTPRTNRSQLMNLAKRLHVDYSLNENYDDLFNRIFLEKIEPVLAKRDEPTILWHYPPSQAALSRLTPDGWADRFELYWRGLEIANAFHELNDVDEQRRRFLDDQKKKASLGRPVVPIDEEFMASLEWGLPPAAGIALGVERLFMALLGIKNLNEARLFPLRIDD